MSFLLEKKLFYIQVNNSTTNTIAQESRETVIRLFPQYARISATTNPAVADHTLEVASNIAGNVITERVTYGT